MTKNHDPVPPVNHGTADARRGPASRLAVVIELLERATAGSRELDVRIVAALRDPPIMVDGGGYKPNQRPARYKPLSEIIAGGWDDWEGIAREAGAEPYTTSLDAALTLVPKGWHGALFFGGKETRSSLACELQSGGPPYYDDGPDERVDDAPTLPLALCIVALRARLSSLQGESDAVGERSSLSDG